MNLLKNEIADFNPGTGFQQGIYKLNALGWSRFDPIYLLHRSISLKGSSSVIEIISIILGIQLI